MFSPFFNVSVVEVVAAFALLSIAGTIFFSRKMLGTAWMRYINLHEDTLRRRRNAAMAIGFFALLLQAYFFAVIFAIARPPTFAHALLVGLLIFLATYFPWELSVVAWGRRPWSLMLLNVAWNALGVFLLVTTLHFL